MLTRGTIIKWIAPRAYGFARAADVEGDVMIHLYKLPPGTRRLFPGDEIDFEWFRMADGRLRATNVKLVEQ